MKNTRIVHLSVAAALGASLLLTGCSADEPNPGASVVEGVESGATAAWEDTKTAAEDFGTQVEAATGEGVDKLQDLTDDFTGKLDELGSDIAEGSTDAWDEAQRIYGDIETHIADGANDVSDSVKSGWDAVKDAWNTLASHF